MIREARSKDVDVPDSNATSLFLLQQVLWDFLARNEPCRDNRVPGCQSSHPFAFVRNDLGIDPLCFDSNPISLTICRRRLVRPCLEFRLVRSAERVGGGDDSRRVRLKRLVLVKTVLRFSFAVSPFRARVEKEREDDDHHLKHDDDDWREGERSKGTVRGIRTRTRGGRKAREQNSR